MSFVVCVARAVGRWASPLPLLLAACDEGAGPGVGRVQSGGLNPAVVEAGSAATGAAADRVACDSGFERPPADCEPTLPTTWEIDCDGDGSPGAQMTACQPEQLLIHNPSSPPGRFDCDDDDGDVHPQAIEIWGDHIDGDCDGREAPTCSALEAGKYSMGRREAAQECEGAGVVLADVVACPHRCDGGEPRVYYYLENRGSERAPTEAVVLVSPLDGPSERVETMLRLAPGQVSGALSSSYDPEAGIVLQLDEDGCADPIELTIEPLAGPCVR